MIRFALFSAIALLLGGCAHTSVTPVGPNDDTKGVRWYDPQPLLVPVD